MKWVSTDERLPMAQEFNGYADEYVIKLSGFAGYHRAMYCLNKKGKGVWYKDFTSKYIVKVDRWLDKSKNE